MQKIRLKTRPVKPSGTFQAKLDYFSPDCRESLGSDLHMCRMERKLSLLNCAKTLHVAYQKIEAIELGRVKKLNLLLYFRLAKLLNYKIQIAMGDEND